MTTDETRMGYDACIETARKLGESAGSDAASWVTDGNTTRAAYERILTGLNDGDPEVLDMLPHADLSGEWADATNGPSLVREVLEGNGLDADDESYGDWFGDICDAYEMGFDQAVQDSLVTTCRYQLEETE